MQAYGTPRVVRAGLISSEDYQTCILYTLSRSTLSALGRCRISFLLFFGQVCDFGLAINMKLETPSSRLGTLQYMSPEVVCRGSTKASRAFIGAPLSTAPYNGMVDVW